MFLIEKKLKKLSPELQQEVYNFVDFLIEKEEKATLLKDKKRPYGLCKGEIKMADDFLQPVSDDILQEWGIL